MDAERRRLVEDHIDFARTYARKRRLRTDDLADVTSDALFGLLVAARRYRPDRGSFAACAVVGMEGAIRRGRQVRSGLSRPAWEAKQPRNLSLSEPAGEQGEIGDTLADSGRDIDAATDALGINQAYGTLHHVERTVLDLRYREGLSQAKIATRIGCSQMQVCRIERRALRRMRAALEAQAA